MDIVQNWVQMGFITNFIHVIPLIESIDSIENLTGSETIF